MVFARFVWVNKHKFSGQLTVSLSTISVLNTGVNQGYHEDVVSWKRFPHYWPFVRGIHRWPVNSPRKGPVMRIVDAYFVVIVENFWTNHRVVGNTMKNNMSLDIHVQTNASLTCWLTGLLHQCPPKVWDFFYRSCSMHRYNWNYVYKIYTRFYAQN